MGSGCIRMAAPVRLGYQQMKGWLQFHQRQSLCEPLASTSSRKKTEFKETYNERPPPSKRQVSGWKRRHGYEPAREDMLEDGTY